MKLPDSAHTTRPWRIHEVAPHFRLEDVWALPTPGERDDFPLLVDGFASANPTEQSSGFAHVLWIVREKLGELFGWDEETDGAAQNAPTLLDRLPPDLRGGPRGPEFESLPAKPLYLLEDEWAAEVANRTVHGVLHLGWVPAEEGGWRGQMAVLVKPNGMFGAAYMTAIRPFRHRIVYPPLMRRLEGEWKARLAEARSGAASAA